MIFHSISSLEYKNICCRKLIKWWKLAKYQIDKLIQQIFKQIEDITIERKFVHHEVKCAAMKTESNSYVRKLHFANKTTQVMKYLNRTLLKWRYENYVNLCLLNIEVLVNYRYASKLNRLIPRNHTNLVVNNNIFNFKQNQEARWLDL